MAGGIWTTQNKIRPGVYFRFKSASNTNLTVGDRGVVAICEPLSWGEVATVQAIENGADVTPYIGYDISSSQAMFLREIFKGSNRTSAPTMVYLYRPAATGSAAATATVSPLTATAKYAGTRGNDITLVITEDVDNVGTYAVETVIDGAIVDTQVASTVADLVDNDWIRFTGTGALASTTGTALTGGANGTVQATAYSSFLAAIEPYNFDVLIYDGTDSTVLSAMQSFVKRIAEEDGKYTQLVAANMTNPDSRFVINVTSGVTLADGTVLTPAQTCWWVGGASAGCRYDQSLTYAAYPDAITISPVLTNAQIITALQNGEFLLTSDDNGGVHVEQDINSLTTYTVDIGKVYRKNKTMRICNTIANDIYQQFSQNYIGIVNNNETGRSIFKAAIVGYLNTMQGTQAIQNFVADDVEVLPGDEIDAIVINLAIQVVDAVEKIYLTVTVG